MGFHVCLGEGKSIEGHQTNSILKNEVMNWERAQMNLGPQQFLVRMRDAGTTRHRLRNCAYCPEGPCSFTRFSHVKSATHTPKESM